MSSRLADLSRFLDAHPDRVFRVRGAVQDAVPDPILRGPQAEVVETGPFMRPVDWSPGQSGFTHFLDGCATHRLVARNRDDLVPLVYGITSAAIRERGEDRVMRTWGQYDLFEQVFAPEHLFLADELRNVIPVVDTKVRRPSATPSDYHRAAVRHVQMSREDLEVKQAQDWAKAGAPGWLLWDGRIDREISPRTVGVIKSHRAAYFDGDRQRAVTALPAAHRTAVFYAARSYSFYLRLHERGDHDFTYGLIRVESPYPSLAEQADEIAGWLMAERTPIPNDPRADRMCYPIKDVEEFLKSRYPSEALIASFF